MRQRARIVLRVRGNLGKGHVAGRLDEFLELPVGDRRAVDPELVHRDAVDRRLFRIVPVRSHTERAAGNQNHAVAPQMLCVHVSEAIGSLVIESGVHADLQGAAGKALIAA